MGRILKYVIEGRGNYIRSKIDFNFKLKISSRIYIIQFRQFYLRFKDVILLIQIRCLKQDSGNFPKHDKLLRIRTKRK